MEKVVQLEAPPLDPVKARHNHLAELRRDAVAHLIVGPVELPGLYGARTVSIVALEQRLPLLHVLHQHGEILNANFTGVAVVEQSWIHGVPMAHIIGEVAEGTGEGGNSNCIDGHTCT